MREIDSRGKTAFAASQYSKEREYWLKKFAGELKKAGFPYDFSPSGAVNGGEDSIDIVFSQETASKLVKLSKEMDHRLYMFLTAGLVVLLHKYTGNDDIVIGSPIFKQEREGDYINTVLPLRFHLDDRVTFKEFLLRQVRPTVTEASQHQNYPLETLLFHLNIPYEGKEFPLFELAVLVENIQHKKYIKKIPRNTVFSFTRNGDHINGVMEYNTGRYKRETSERIVRHYNRLMEIVTGNLDIPLSRIDILSPQEKDRLLHDFNDTRREYPAHKTIDQIFAEQVARTPEKIALTYEGQPMTYSRLDREAENLAAFLRSTGLRPQEPVAVIMENSLKVIVVILGILKAGGAYLPINSEYPEERKKYIVQDCAAKRLITNCKDSCALPSSLIVIDADDPAIYTRHEQNPASSIGRDPGRYGNDLAYIMYTSGSTGTPKGVMVEHKSVARLVKNTDFVSFEKDDSILLTGALEFDASTFEIWGALLNGLTLHLVHKNTILNPESLKNAVAQNKVTTMWMTAPLFNQVLDADIEIFRGLKNLLVGGDILSVPHINRVRERFADLNVINGYGPTENTTFSTAFRVEKSYRQSIPIGKPIRNSTVFILDSRCRPVPVGVTGELFVGGEGLARGYLNNPQLTRQKFINLDPPMNTLYRTGDLARWLPDGNVEFLGRMDQQVKIRGFRVEPGEIENRLNRVPGVKESVVLIKQTPDLDKYLCAYVVPSDDFVGEIDVVELRRELSAGLPDYMVPSYFVPLEHIPLTVNGKVDKRALPEPDTAGGAPYAAPRNRDEEKIAEIWAEVLKVEKENIGIDSDFFELGGHSLKATILLSKLNKAFDVKVPLAELFRLPTIRELTPFIGGLTKDRFSSIKNVELKEYYELSSAQKRLFVLQQMEVDSTVYNVPQAVVLEGQLDLRRLENTFKTLIKRHESLRTDFLLVNETPVQVVRDFEDISFAVEYNDMPSFSRFIRPFDISRAPLMRVGVFGAGLPADRHEGSAVNTCSGSYILAVDMHHIITDGTSMDLFVKEFMAIYAGRELPALKFQYKDYSEWQAVKTRQEDIRKQEEFWMNQLAGEIPVLDLPIDFPRPSVQSFEGATVTFELPARQIQALRQLASDEGGTLYIVLMAVFNVLLSKLGGQEDIIVGTPIAARRHVDLERIIGMFVNTLPMRNYPRGEKPFLSFLKEVKTTALEAFENQEYQFEDLVDRLAVVRDASRNPLFDVILAMPNMEAQTGKDVPDAEMPGLRMKPYESGTRTAKFDLNFACEEIEGKTIFLIEYCSRLFTAETIQRIILYFKNVVSGITENPYRKISQIEILPEKEKERILNEWSHAASDYPKEKTIHQLFREQARLQPNHIAVVSEESRGGEVSLTYGQLDKKSDNLARLLRSRGVGPDAIVGMMAERSSAMITGLLGILKAGGAYLAINPRYPESRIDYMLKDSHTRWLLTETGNEATVPFDGEIIGLNSIDDDDFSLYPDLPHTSARFHHQAYTIYTSGSTGKPKGVIVEHRNVVRLVKNSNFIRLEKSRKILQTGALEFDASTFEIWGALLNGLTLYLVPNEQILDPQTFKQTLRRHEIDTIWLTAPLFNEMVNADVEIFQPLANLLVGGDALSPPHIDKVRNRYPRINIINGYGPTENTTFSTTFLVDNRYETRIPIGKPVSNSSAYIVDRANRLTPTAVAGELVVGGDGVSRGYLNSPELTHETFIDNPFKERDRLYRTGDRVRWMPDGNIEFLGRIDQQVKIRGFRIELQEIENAILTNEKIKDAVVIAVKTGTESTDKYLCAYVVATEELKPTETVSGELKRYLTRLLPDYMIPAHIVPMERFPLTPNGKVDRAALPKPQMDLADEYIPPRNNIEIKLVDIWSEVLGIDKEKIGIQTNFFDLGGHSLKATVLAAKIHKALAVQVPLAEIFRTQTVKGLAEFIQSANEAVYVPLLPAEEKEYYAMSSAQKRMLIVQQMFRQSSHINSTSAFEMFGPVSLETLKNAFRKLIRRHESLRTSFHLIDEEYYQKIHTDAPVELEFFQLEGRAGMWEEVRGIEEKFVRPFILESLPLFRVGLVNVDAGHHILMVDMHHIITDGTSMGILFKDLAAFYEERPLPPLTVQYKDFALWQNKLAESGGIERQKKYWLNLFEKEAPLLNLPTDFPRVDSLTLEGGSLSFTIEKNDVAAIQALAALEDATLFMVLLTGFYVLLAKESGQEDIVVGSPVTGRRHEDSLQMIGMFANLLALRNYPSPTKTFRQFMREVKGRILTAVENQDYPLEELVKEVAPSAGRNPGRHPLFDIAFALQNYINPEIEISGSGVKLKPYNFKYLTVRYDLEFVGCEHDGGISFTVLYRKKLFREKTVEKLVQSFKTIFSRAIENPDIKISEIELLSSNEKDQIIFGFNTETEGNYDF